MKKTIIVLLVLLTACASPATPPAPDMVTVQHTFSTQAWIPNLYSCASDVGVAISTETRAADFFDPSGQLWIRLGEPGEASSTAYEIGTEEIVVVVHPENPLPSLTLSGLRAIFGGEIQNWSEVGGDDIPIQVWIFGPSEDIRQIFDAAVMQQQPVSSQARLAASVDSLVAGVVSDPGAIGFLPRSLVDTGIQIINIDNMPSSLTVPVLILASPDADQILMTLVSCLQGK